jgi:putative transposase
MAASIKRTEAHMVRYRRERVPGASYFFTLTLDDRRASTLVDHAPGLVDAVRAEQHRRPFTIVAMVLLPDHLHAIWTLPDGDADYSGRWRAIKSDFVRRLRLAGDPVRRNARGEVAVWQPRFWEHRIRDSLDLARHVDYIHFNPVKHGLVERASDWRWSSLHRYIRDGIHAPDWAAPADATPGTFGE